MASLILTQETLQLSLRSQRLLVTFRDGTTPPRSLHLREIDRVVVSGKPALTTAALAALMDNGIPLYFVTTRGRWRGALTPDGNRNGRRRLLQYEQSLGASFPLRIARGLICAKLRNSRRVLQRLAANRGEAEDDRQRQVNDLMSRYAVRVAGAADLGEVRGLEGIAAACYFDRLGDFVTAPFSFRTRTRRPPRDPVNALLSYGYSVLQGEVECAIRAHGLDSSIGCLHRNPGTSPSLALDLMEPLRPAVIDLVVLNLVNHRRLSPGPDFESGDDEAVYLSGRGRSAFFHAYEETMERRFIPAPGATPMTFRQAIDRQVVEFLHALEEGRSPRFFALP